MLRKSSFAAMMLLALLFAGAANAGPFGTEMGDDIKKFSTAKEIKPFLYSSDTLPKTHSAFESYGLKHHPATGLCQVSAYSFNFDNDRYGSKLRQAFANLRAQLDGVYGKSELYDHLNGGALWKDPNEWVMAIAKNERAYQAVWKAANGATMKDNVVEILLTANAGNSDTSWFSIQYRYKNHRECDKAIADSAAGVL